MEIGAVLTHLFIYIREIRGEGESERFRDREGERKRERERAS
jgi:hypothetical protein